MSTQTEWFCFLDDERVPGRVSWVALPEVPWTTIRTYEDFCEQIRARGLPRIVSFDHDLAQEHYEALATDVRKHVVAYDEFETKTGYHCAKFMIDYCLRTGAEIPEVFIHTMNPIGREKIHALVSCARKFHHV